MILLQYDNVFPVQCNIVYIIFKMKILFLKMDFTTDPRKFLYVSDLDGTLLDGERAITWKFSAKNK